MKADFANAFISSALSVFQKETGVKMSRKDLKLKPAPVPTLDLSVVIGVTGAVKGQVVYSMDENFALGVSKALLPGRLPVDVKRFAHSAVSEMANMISGKASIALAGDDQVIHLTPPAIFAGRGVMIDFLSVPTVCISFISELGVLEINIALVTA